VEGTRSGRPCARRVVAQAERAEQQPVPQERSVVVLVGFVRRFRSPGLGRALILLGRLRALRLVLLRAVVLRFLRLLLRTGLLLLVRIVGGCWGIQIYRSRGRGQLRFGDGASHVGGLVRHTGYVQPLFWHAIEEESSEDYEDKHNIREDAWARGTGTARHPGLSLLGILEGRAAHAVWSP